MPNENSRVKNGVYWAHFEPPALPEEQQLRAAVERAAKMAPHQVFESSVKAGIHNPDGTLTEHYQSKPPPKP